MVPSSRRHTARLALIAGLLAVLAQPAAVLAQQPSILALHGVRKDDVVPIDADHVMRRVIEAGLARPVDYYSEQVDLVRFSDANYLEGLRDFLKQKYAGRRIDVVIPVTDATLGFVNANGSELFPGAAVVFTATERPRQEGELPTTGVTATIDLSRSIAMAARLQPGLKRVFVVSGSSPFDRFYAELARAQLRTFEGRLEITHWSGLPLADLLARVAALPPDSIVYPVTITEDPTGHRFTVLEAFDQITKAANVPVYTWFSTFMDRGVVGGSMFSVDVVGTRVAQLALRVLGGEKPGDIPVVEIDPNVEQLDWRQLQRWGISEELVLPGTTVRFRTPGLWERYRNYIIATGVLVVLQTALIGGLLVQRARRQKVETALRTSEADLRKSHDRNHDLAGRLISAQEAERARIARDLHDDVSQQLAALAITVSGVRHRVKTTHPDADVEKALVTMQEVTAVLADNVRSLSHEMHSGVLQYAGLVPALEEHCATFERHHGIDVTLTIDGEVDPLAPDVALCLYRVVQEALANVARHARARTALVRLARTGGGIELDVVDDGVGFDAPARNGNGLGLRSIEERVRLARGRVSIESSPGRGTTLNVRIPPDIATAATGSADNRIEGV